MRKTLSIALAAIGIAYAQSTNHTVIVGGAGGAVTYTPNQLNASIGDVVTFIFQQKNHTVTQSTFENPCTALEGGFDSGFQPVSADNTNGPFPSATLTIHNTDPVWVYCRQTNHCAMGMVMGINPAGKFAAFLAAAEATGNSGTSTSSSSGSSSSSSSSSSSGSSSTPPPASQPPPSASPTDHLVIVGFNGTLTYFPSNITAEVGDTVTFQFHAKNHTATQSSFNDPCRMIGATSGTPGFDSGFMPVSANATDFPTMTITVNDTAPIWAYCRQDNPTSHCGSGMVFAVNANESSSKSFEAFQALAIQLNGTNSTSAPPPGTTTKSAGLSLHVVPAALIGTMVSLLLGLSL